MQGGSACQQESGSHGSISYSAGISACEKGKQWQRALALLSEMWAAKLEPDVICTTSATALGSARARKARSGSWRWRCSARCGRRSWSNAGLSYSAGISACEKGEQWQWALALLSEMWEVKVEPNVVSYSAGISACEKGKQWQLALALLSEMREAKLDQLQRWDQRVREWRAVAAGAGAAERDAGSETGAQRHQLQRWDQRVREGRAVAVGTGATERDVGSEGGAHPSAATALGSARARRASSGSWRWHY
ncbi:unnamed protein product [Prorocentrum cordatum]|uniref:Pentatricopeptide repeat-containing protein, chloroplastic n=1 Tax=Prorocentrum cordatum TaxID=2364126 RepID=A0ABN9UFK5_9DINO|nr:unnamed protein product [Polarella glacialis]